MLMYIPFKIKVVPNRILKMAKNIAYKINPVKAMTTTKITTNILIIMVHYYLSRQDFIRRVSLQTF